MKTAPELIADITEEQMIRNLHQVQHMLNHLMGGKKYDGSKLDIDKLQNYKFSIIKIIDKYKS